LPIHFRPLYGIVTFLPIPAACTLWLANIPLSRRVTGLKLMIVAGAHGPYHVSPRCSVAAYKSLTFSLIMLRRAFSRAIRRLIGRVRKRLSGPGFLCAVRQFLNPVGADVRGSAWRRTFLLLRGVVLLAAPANLRR